MGQALLLLAPLPNNVRDQTTNAYNNSNDAQDLSRATRAANFITRVDAVLGANTRLSAPRAVRPRRRHRAEQHRAGHRRDQQQLPGQPDHRHDDEGAQPVDGQRDDLRLQLEPLGSPRGQGRRERLELHAVVAAERHQPAHRPDGPVPAAPRSVWRVRRTRPEEHEQGRVAVSARAALHGRRPREPAPDAPVRLERPAAEVEPQPARHAARTTCPTRAAVTTSSSGSRWSATSRRSRARRTTPGSTTSVTTRRNPISTGNGYANALLGVFTTYTERNDRIDRENRHWYGGFYAQDSWRLTSRLTLDYGLRMEHHGADLRSPRRELGLRPGAVVGRPNAPVLYEPACTVPTAGNASCSSTNQAAIDPRFPDVYLIARASSARSCRALARSPTACGQAG